MMSWAKVHEYSDFLGAAAEAADEVVATPMRFAQVIHLSDAGTRETVPMRWGFSDLRAKSPIDRPKHMHARAETIDVLPTFADAFRYRRGIVVVNTFNEGEELPGGKTRQWTITPNDGKPIGIGVVYERWTHRTEGEFLTFVMVTTPANALIGKITDRMPAILPPEQWAKWLGEESLSLQEVKALLVPFEGDWTMEPAKRSSPPPKPATQAELF